MGLLRHSRKFSRGHGPPFGADSANLREVIRVALLQASRYGLGLGLEHAGFDGEFLEFLHNGFTHVEHSKASEKFCQQSFAGVLTSVSVCGFIATVMETETKKKRRTYKHNLNANKLKVDGVKMTAARIAASLSGAEVARRLGCNKGSVCKWEMNHLIPSEERLFRLIEMFGTADFLDWNSVGLDRLAELGEKVKQHLKEGKK